MDLLVIEMRGLRPGEVVGPPDAGDGLKGSHQAHLEE